MEEDKRPNWFDLFKFAEIVLCVLMVAIALIGIRNNFAGAVIMFGLALILNGFLDKYRKQVAFSQYMQEATK